jgi:hypothetical protein
MDINITAHDKDAVLNFYLHSGQLWQSKFHSPGIQVLGYSFQQVHLILEQFEQLGFVKITSISVGGFMEFRMTLLAQDFFRLGGFQMQELGIQQSLSMLMDDLIEFKGNPIKTDTMTWDLVVKIEKVSVLLKEAMPLIEMQR